MTLTKAGIVQTIAQRTGLTKNQPIYTDETLMELMQREPGLG